MNGNVLFCTDTFGDAHGAALRAIDPAIQLVRLTGTDDVPAEALERITLAYFSPDLFPDRPEPFMSACLLAPELRWMHTCTAGTDNPVFATLRSRMVLTNGVGAAAPSIAQSVMMYLLAISRQLPRLLRSQTERMWDPLTSTDLSGLRLAIVGLGAIGSEVARLAAAFGMEVIGLRRKVTGTEPCTTWPTHRLHEALAWADAVAVTAPLNAATRRLFDADAFTAMRSGAWFVNVGRGEIVDEVALVEALADGRLGAAALDVFVTEPLPSDSPLWEMPNVIITPHSSGDTELANQRSDALFLENLSRYVTGTELLNVTADEPT